MSFGIIASMENAENEVGADQNEVEAAQTETEVVRAEAEINEDVVEISSDEKDMGEAVEAADELQEMGEVAQAAVDSGEGLSEDAAAMATVAIERISLKMFGTRAQSIVPARESFGSSNSRLAATVAVVEGIVDTIKRIWKGIKAFAMRIWDKIKMLWNKVVGSTKNYEKHLKNLRERAEKLDSGATVKESDLKSESLAASITDGNKKADFSTFKKHLEQGKVLFEIKKKLDSHSRAAAVELVRASATLADDKNFDLTEGTSQYAQAIQNSFSEIAALDIAKVDGVDTKTKGDSTYQYWGPIANAVAVEVVETKVPKTDKRDGYVIVSIGTKRLKKDQIAKKASALTRAEILNLIDYTLDFSKLVNSKQSDAKVAEEMTNSIKSLSDKVISNAEDLVKDGANSTNLEIIKKHANMLMQYANVVNSLCMSNSATLIAAGANYASAALANVKFKKS